MTIPVVQFCFAVASGDSTRVDRLLARLSDKDLFEGNDFGVSPALFCFLALSYARDNKPQALFEKLRQKLPLAMVPRKYHDQLTLEPASVVAASLIAIKGIKLKLGNNLSTFLHTMVPHFSHDLDGDMHTQLTLKSCMEALREALKDSPLSETQRASTATILEGFANLYLAPIPNQSPAPISVKYAMQQQRTFLRAFPQKCASDKERRLDKIIQEIPQHFKIR
jgi:hypothetical protein